MNVLSPPSDLNSNKCKKGMYRYGEWEIGTGLQASQQEAVTLKI
jgi:hypothetical protein